MVEEAAQDVIDTDIEGQHDEDALEQLVGEVLGCVGTDDGTDGDTDHFSTDGRISTSSRTTHSSNLRQMFRQ